MSWVTGQLPIDNLVLGALTTTKLWLFRAISICLTRTPSRKVASKENSFDREHGLLTCEGNLSLI